MALALVGPGLFLIGYNIGTGSVTTMAQTGAAHGMSLFWALVLSCLFTYILLIAYGKHSLVAGKTALNSLRTQFKWGPPVALYILIAIILGELLALMGIMGIVSDLINLALQMAFGDTVESFWIISILALLIFLLLWQGRYQSFEKLLSYFVILMAISFALVFIMVRPDFVEISKGLIPSFTQGPGSFGLVAAIAGTTCSAAVFIVRSIVVHEKGWNENNLRAAKRDAFVSAFMMLILSGLIMAVAAGTLHKMGQQVNNTIDMVKLFEPLGGKLAALVLIVGVASAGLSTIFPIVLIAPWLLADYQGKRSNLKSPISRWLITGGLLFAFGSVFIEKSPPALMIFSQAFQACILPAVAIPILIMLNQKPVMGPHIASARMNVGLVLVVLFSLLTTWMAVTDILK